MAQMSGNGRVAIFNFQYFDDPSNKQRRGANQDVENLKLCFKGRSRLSVHHDLTTNQLRDALLSLADSDHSNVDYLLCFFGSHGDCGDVLFTRDGRYPVRDIIELFNDEKCPSLCGKPKIFFVQMCRGKSFDTGATRQTLNDIVEPGSPTAATDSSADSTEDAAETLFTDQLQYLSAVMSPNSLVVFSTAPGRYSLRRPSVGSYFIDYFTRLVMEYKEKGKELFVTALLMKTNSRIAREFTGKVVTERGPRGKKYMLCKQIGVFVSTLLTDVAL